MTWNIPPDTRVTGGGFPAEDMNNLVDCVTNVYTEHPSAVSGSAYQALGGGHSSKLQGWFAALASRNTARCNIAIIGDSISEGNGAASFAQIYPQQLAAMLNARFPTAGLSTHGRGFLSPAPYNIFPWSASYITVTGGTLSPTDGYGPGLQTFNIAAGSGYTLAYSLTGTSADIMWAGYSGNGSFEWKVDSGSYTTVSTSTGSLEDGQITHVSLGSAGAHTLTIAVESAGAGVYIDGVTEYYNDYSSGIQVHTCGLGGSQTGAWLSSGGNVTQPAAMAALSPGLIIVELGLNDANNGVSAAAYAANLAAIVAGQRAAYTTPPPFLLVAAYDAFGSGTDGSVSPSTWATYVDAAYAVAAADSEIDILDLTLRMPPTSASTDPWDLYYSDNTHPNSNGHQMIADALCSFLSPY